VVTAGKATRESALLRDPGSSDERWIDVKRVTFDRFGMVSESIDANGNRAWLEYEPKTHAFVTGELIDAGEGGTIGFHASYDLALGTLLSSTDANQNETGYTYDGLGRLRTVVDRHFTDLLATVTYDYTYGTRESPISLIVESQLVDRATRRYQSVWQYMDAGGQKRLTKAQNDRGDGYIASGFASKSAAGNEVVRYKDFASAALGIEPAPAGTPVEEIFHDAVGRVVRIVPVSTGGRSTFTTTTYLPMEVRAFDEQDTAEGTWLYPAITRVDGLGRVRQTVRYNDYRASDGTARVRTELAWTYMYDPLGNVVGWTDPKGNLREYAYDSLSRLVDLRDPNIGAVHYAHDDAGNVTQRVDALGQSRSFVFGAANRLQRMIARHDVNGHPDYEYVYHYDRARMDGPLPEAANLVGRLAWVEWPAGSHYTSFDHLGHVVTDVESLWDPARSPFEAQERDTFREDHVYNAAGWNLQTSLPGGRRFSWTYTRRGLAATVSTDRGDAPQPLIAAIDYDVMGQARRTLAANGTASCAWFNDRNEFTGLASGPATSIACDADATKPLPGAFQHLVFERDLGRSIARVSDLSTNGNLPKLDAEYTHDRLHEVTSSRTARGTETYEYDPIQNLVRHTSSVPGTRAVLGDLQYGESAGPNQLTSGGDRAFAYDAVGNMKAYNGYALEFDVEGRLTSARKSNNTSVQNYYDSGGERRITVVEQPGKPSKVYRFVFGGYQIRDGEEIWSAGGGRVSAEIRRTAGGEDAIHYTFSDHLLGASHVTDAAGTIIGYQQFSAYGELNARIGAPPLRGYAGSLVEPEEDLGLVRFGARYYAPGIGRWISGDAFIGESPSKALERPMEANLYGYVSGNPVDNIDPSGRYQEDVHGALTYLLALAAGFKPDDAKKVAFATADVDHDDRRKPVSFKNILSLRTYHYHFDGEAANKGLNKEIAKGANMSLVQVGEYLHCLEDTGFPGETKGPHMRGKTYFGNINPFTALILWGKRTTHGWYITENGKLSWPLHTNTDVVRNNPVQNAKQFRELYEHLKQVQRAMYGKDAAKPNDGEAMAIIKDVTTGGENPITIDPRLYGLRTPSSYDDLANAEGRKMNVTVNSIFGHNPNGENIKTPIDEGL
jgi:RHS repeat-associated protein